jgi:hypothetical protein
MSDAASRIQKRRLAIESLRKVGANPSNVVVIHYSCESFYDRVSVASPRITSIAVRNLGSAQTVSFSIHQMAERDKKVSLDDIQSNYDDLEKKMLKEFYEYVDAHQNHLWLHWSMRDSNYGFPALAHRFKVLGGKPTDIHESQLFDLARILAGIFGPQYAEHPRMAWLAKKNDISDRDSLSGEDEATAFEKREYMKLHQSTLRKVDILANIFERTAGGTLQTNATRSDIFGSHFRYACEVMRDHWAMTLLGILGSVASVVAFVLYLFSGS